MCGIAGAVMRDPDARLVRSVVEVTHRLAHRGPDDEGFLRVGAGGAERCGAGEAEQPGRVIFGHRRLSIVDLVGGAQPMANEDGTVWVSFNGEIYNHLDLRRQLTTAGHVFCTRADTEVLVHGWEEWGEGLFGRLNGIFALSLYDGRTGDVVLARDPLGVKPLYVGTTGGATWWSSELAAARLAGLADGEVSADALALFLTFRFVPSPYAAYEDVWKLPPGHFARLLPRQAGAPPRFAAFRTRVRSSASPRTQAEWREAVITELEAAVERQLMADVPVASLLSGGVDSSLVTLAMARGLSERPTAFAIGFGSEGAAAETEAAAFAAAELGVALKAVVVADDDYVASWPGACREVGEPIGNSGILLISLLCEEVGRSHKVVLTGQGADEPLGGYPRHAAERLWALGRRVPGLSTRVIRSTLGPDAAQRLARAFAVDDRLDRYIELFSVLAATDVEALVRGTSAPPRELARQVVATWADETPPDDLVNELLRIDARMSLADDLLLIADHFSMRSSVELRVPFLDLELVELLERMPSRYKISRLGRRKWLYQGAAFDRLPPRLRTRLRRRVGVFGPKRGFSTPLERWFRDEGGPLARPDEWVGPLTRLPALSEDALLSLLDDRSAHFARQLSVLYSLGAWAAGPATAERRLPATVA